MTVQTLNPNQVSQAIATYQQEIAELQRQFPNRSRQRAIAHFESLIEELESQEQQAS